MKSCGIWFLVVLALLVGLAFGLLVGWVVWPVQWTDASPEGLQANWRLEWLNMSADSYARNPNPEVAQQRFSALGKYAPEALSTLQAGAQGERAAEIKAFAEAVASGSPAPEQSGSQEQPAANDLVGRLLKPPLFGYVAAGLFLALLAVVLLVVLVIRLFSGGRQPAIEAPLAPEPVAEAQRIEPVIEEMEPAAPLPESPEIEAAAPLPESPEIEVAAPVAVRSEIPEPDQAIGPLENAPSTLALTAPVVEEWVENAPASEPAEEISIPEPVLEMPVVEAPEPPSEELEVADLQPETPAEPAPVLELPEEEEIAQAVSLDEAPSEIPSGIEWALEEAPEPIAAAMDAPAEIEAVAQEASEIEPVEPVETPDLQAAEQAIEEELDEAESSDLAIPPVLPVQAEEWIPERENEADETPRAAQFNRAVSEIQGIGSEYSQVLAAQGIDTLHAFLQRCASAKGRQGLAEKTGLPGKLISRWTRQADLLRIRGLSPQAAELFELAGVTSIRDLAGRKAEQLSQKLLETNQANTILEVLPSQAMIEEWIEQAKDLPRILDN